MAVSHFWTALMCVLGCLVLSAESNNSYLILSPYIIRPGVPFSVSVSVLQSPEELRVTASVRYTSTNETVVSNVVFLNQGETKTFQLMMPEDTVLDGLKSYSYQLYVAGHKYDGFHFENTSHIEVIQESLSVLIQTDKAIYKPGQTVKYRVMAIYPNGNTYSGKFDIMIKDPLNNIIQHETDLQDPVYGVIEGEMVTSTEPILGDWQIIVTTQDMGSEANKIFVIDEYVLPKFEVEMVLPDFTEETDPYVLGTIKAKYTYGKPVKGTAVLKATVRSKYEINDQKSIDSVEVPSLSITEQIDGETGFQFSLEEIKNRLFRKTFPEFYHLLVTGDVTDELTGIVQSTQESMPFYIDPYELKILDMSPKTFKPGMVYSVFVSVTLENGKPLRRQDDKTVDIAVYSPQAREEVVFNSYDIPENGIITISGTAPTDDNINEIRVEAKYTEEIADFRQLRRAYSPSNNFIQITTQASDLRDGNVVTFDVAATEPFSSYFLNVMSRGNIIVNDVKEGSASRTHTFELEITAAFAPTAYVFVYYIRNDGEVVPDSLSINVKGTFENKVNLAFNQDAAQPADEIQIDVTASPNSFVGLLAVDQSVLLLKSGNDITDEEVVKSLWKFHIGEKPTDEEADQNMGMGNVGFDMPVMREFVPWWNYPWSGSAIDPYSVIRMAGLMVLTDTNVAKAPREMSTFSDYEYVDDIMPVYRFDEMVPEAMEDGAIAAAAPDMTQNKADASPVTHVRKLFPETWLWTDSISGADGKVSFTSTVPDTITSWVASAFAVSQDTGFGVAPTTASLNAFKPFFVSLNLPYSIIRGERFALQAIVFNYQPYDVQVNVTLMMSDDFQNVVIVDGVESEYVNADKTRSVFVPSGEGKTVSFPIQPTKIGTITLKVMALANTAADVVQRNLLVVAEGLPKEYNHNFLIDINDSEQTETFEIDDKLTSDVVEGSVKVQFSVVGDLIGKVMNNLEQLVVLPTGCGEQVMIFLAPDVYVYKYLVATGQGNSDISKKALDYITSGYQRELTFRHSDGSFSAFGKRDAKGSSWLTAFVYKCFVQAMDMIYIDTNILNKALQWLLNTQSKTGEFMEVGISVDSIQGRLEGKVGLTAFVAIAISHTNSKLTDAMPLELKRDLDTAKSNAKTFLETELNNVEDTFTLAVVTLALHHLHSAHKEVALEKLRGLATIEGAMMYWRTEVEQENDLDPFLRRLVKSADIKIAGYALMIYNLREEFAISAQIKRWLEMKISERGAFTTTQDTMLVIEGLSDFSIRVQNNINMSISLTSSDDRSYKPAPIKITTESALVLHQFILPVTTGKVTVTSTGVGTILGQITIFYHTTDDLTDNTFNVVVVTDDVSNNRINIAACASNQNPEPSGMAVMEVGIPSGFYAVEESLTNLVESAQVKRTEQEDRKVVFYFDEIGTQETCVSFPAQRMSPVAKSQTAAVRVYDYYKPERKGVAMYVSQTLSNIGVCGVCEDCDGCDVEPVKTSNKQPRITPDITIFLSILAIIFAKQLM